MMPIFYFRERYSEQIGKKRKQCPKNVGFLCEEPGGGDMVRVRGLLQGPRKMPSTGLISEPRRQCPPTPAADQGRGLRRGRCMSKALGQGQSGWYPVSPEAEEEGQRGGARIPGARCLVIQGACVRHSVDETEAGGQCWRPQGTAEMPVDRCHRSPDKRCCWLGLGPGWRQPKKVASSKTYVFQRENAPTLLMG